VRPLLSAEADFGLSSTFVIDDTVILRLRNRSTNGVPRLINRIKKIVNQRMYAYNFHPGKSYFIVSVRRCDSLATGVITDSNDIALLMIGLVNRFDDPFPSILLKLRKRHRNEITEDGIIRNKQDRKNDLYSNETTTVDD
jgi:hypothetical protein